MPYPSCVREKTITLLPKNASAGHDYLKGAAITDDGSVVLAGGKDGDFGAVKLDANGTKVWAWQVKWHVGRPKLAG